MISLFLEFLRTSIGSQCALNQTITPVEWRGVFDMSVQQGVTAVVFNFVRHLPKAMAPDMTLLMEWIMAAYGVEKTMLRMQMTAEEFAEEMAKRQIPVVVLKGMAFAQYYPNPLHRECGDLDCYMMGKKEDGDKITVELGGRMEQAGYKHSHLSYKGLTIENHSFFTDFDNTAIGILTEQVLSQLIQEEHANILNSKQLSPSRNFNALFLIKHAQRHFIDEGIRMRHVLDWALFLRAEQEKVDWKLMLPILVKTRTVQFAGVMTAIAVQHLHIDIQNKGLLSLVECIKPRMVDAVLSDIMDEQPAIYVGNLWHKTKRIVRRFRRMWKFRTLASESYLRMVWNAFAFSSYLKRKVVVN